MPLAPPPPLLFEVDDGRIALIADSFETAAIEGMALDEAEDDEVEEEVEEEEEEEEEGVSDSSDSVDGDDDTGEDGLDNAQAPSFGISSTSFTLAPGSLPAGTAEPGFDATSDDTADTNIDDTTDTSVDVDECLFGCGVGCPAPEFQICGSDGNLYCNSCYMGCLGIAPASQRSVCDPCGVYDAATALPYRLWPTPDSCMMSFDSGSSFSVATTEAELRAMLPCMDPATAITGIDWSIEVVAQVTQAYNPALTVQGVFSTPTGVAVATRSPIYCGGAAPPTAAAYVIVGAGSVGLHQESCIDGECVGGPFP
jgi:hypothetical protein